MTRWTTPARSATRQATSRRRGVLELLLQATDDLSLVVNAEEVWRAGDQLQRASRSLSAPHEVFLAELGRAVRIYPELGQALRQPTPTGLALDLDGAHRFLAGAAPALEVAGFGVLLPRGGGGPRPAWAYGSRRPHRPPRPEGRAREDCSTRTASAPSTGKPHWATSRSTRPSCSGWPS